MKIEEIRINGIRGFNYVKDENGDPSPHVIQLNGKHLFLYGENGTGKSSLFDAVEWCLTGEIKEASNRRISKQKNFLVNKFCDDKDNPFVEISFDQRSNPTKFQRSIKASKQLFNYTDEAEACLIESNRIEQFVIDTKKTLWQRFSDLLGFEKLIIFDDQLVRLKNESKRQYTSANTEFVAKKERVDRVKKETEEFERIFENEFGVDWRDRINYQDDHDENKRYNNLETIIDKINKYEEMHKSYFDAQEEKNKNQLLLSQKKKASTISEISKIVNEAYKYFSNYSDLETCPVCNQKIEFKEVYRRLGELRESLAEITRLEFNLNGNIKDVEKYEAILTSYASEMKMLNKDLYGEELVEELAFEDIFRFIRDKKTSIEEERNNLKKKVLMNKQIVIYQEKINHLSEYEAEYSNCEQELKLNEIIYNDIEAYYDKYVELYSKQIRKELNSICENEVTQIYKYINKSDYEPIDNLIIEPDIRTKDITFLAEIKNDSEKIDATEFLSTGHLRCLGFACLIARINAKINNLNFIIIDDPIYSIDHEHRYNLIQYLIELGKKYQLIITSSDRLFFDILRHNFNPNKFVSYETSVSNDCGVTLEIKMKKQKQYIDEAMKYLEMNDYRAASLYARLSLETKLFEIAKKLKLEIPINRMEKITIKELMDAKLRTKLSDKYKGDYPNKALEIGHEFDKLYNHRYFKSLLNGFPLDQEVHYPHEDRIIYSKIEIETVIDSIDKFNKFIDSLPNW
jgi:DNA repair exonuclease SbcCD ATPase subunit